MGRNKSGRRGKNLTIYLTPERMDRLASIGPDPAKVIYDLIDAAAKCDLPYRAEDEAKSTQISPTSIEEPKGMRIAHTLCPTCKRRGNGIDPLPACTICRSVHQ